MCAYCYGYLSFKTGTLPLYGCVVAVGTTRYTFYCSASLQALHQSTNSHATNSDIVDSSQSQSHFVYESTNFTFGFSSKSLLTMQILMKLYKMWANAPR